MKAPWTAPADLDPEIAELCAALNALPGIVTYGSCCGHGEAPVHVSFLYRRDEELAALLYLLDPCHGAPRGWRVEVHSDCGMGGPFYGVEGPAGGYDGGRVIAGLITEHLAEPEPGEEEWHGRPQEAAYSCPQCGPDPAGADAHAQSHSASWPGLAGEAGDGQP